MTEDELGRVLRDMYDNAPEGDKVVNIHLFGIKHAEDIAAAKSSATGVVRASGIKQSFATEVTKGMRLARFVTVK